jgi:glycosyltransferase involved in cell wall biosynthesis
VEAAIRKGSTYGRIRRLFGEGAEGPRLSHAQKPRLAVVSPFLDKSHGTERIVIEWIMQLAAKFEIHVYSQEVRDIDPSAIFWHRVPKFPGPHIINFLWWFAANHSWREWDRRVRGLKYDLTFSPGPNCLDADVISVHIVFGEFLRRVHQELKLTRNPIRFWPRLIHRRLFYRLAILLERHVYRNPAIVLILIAQKTAADLARLYGRRDRCVVLYLGLDHVAYNPARRAALRGHARTQIGLVEDTFALLMVGNDWHKKGIGVLFDALNQLRDLPVDLLIAGGEDPVPFRAMAADQDLVGRVHFLPPRKDVEFYYAAADAYAGPSLEDTFALPPVEAMACGVPAIVSAENGTCEIITDGVNGMILRDPRDAAGLASMIRRLYEDEPFRMRLGEKAAETAQQFTWERNGHELAAIFEEILQGKSGFAAQTLAQEP